MAQQGIVKHFQPGTRPVARVPYDHGIAPFCRPVLGHASQFGVIARYDSHQDGHPRKKTL
jgi:hypothetical protein